MATAALALFAAAKPVHAAKLGWSSPPECERADVVEARVEELSGRPLATLETPQFEVNVARTDGGWQLTLVTQTTEGTSRRELSGRTCAEITDAAAVVMAMAIRAAVPDTSASEEPGPAAEEPVQPPAPEVTATSSAKSREPAAMEPRPAAKPSRVLGGLIGIAAALDTATLPGPAPGVEIWGGVRWGWLRVELQGVAFAPSTATLSDGRSGTFSLLSGALLGCIEPGAWSVAVFGCGGLELGRLAGEGHGVSNPEVGTALWSAARLEVGAGLKLNSSLRLVARVGVAVPFTRREFVLDGEAVHEPATLSARAALGVDFLW